MEFALILFKHSFLLHNADIDPKRPLYLINGSGVTFAVLTLVDGFDWNEKDTFVDGVDFLHLCRIISNL